MLKHFIFTLLSLYAIGLSIQAQTTTGWFKQDVLLTGLSTVNKVHFVNQDTGFAVTHAQSDRAYVLRTYDGGETPWDTTSFSISNNLVAIFFQSETSGYIGGQGGTIYKTTDAGQSWQDVSLVGDNIVDFYFFNNDTGYSVGQNGEIHKTEDGGMNWSPIASGTTELLRKITFTSTDTGHIIGAGGTYLRSTNGGNTWNNLSANMGGLSIVIRDMHFSSNNIGYVVGENGTIRKTTDAGTSWTPLNSPTDELLRAVHFINDSIGMIVGADQLQAGITLRTFNGGSSWNLVELNGYNRPYNSVSLINRYEGYAAGPFLSIYKTNVFGARVNTQYSIPSGTLEPDTIHFCDSAIVDIGEVNYALWSNGATSSVFTIATPGIYSVQVEQTTGYAGFDTIIAIQSLGEINWPMDSTICEATSLSAGIGSDFNWSTGSTDSSIQISTSGLYSITKLACGSSYSDSINITVLPKPTAEFTISDSVLCFDFAGEAGISLQDISTGTDCRIWNFHDGSTNTQESLDYSYYTPGTFNIKLVVCDGVCTDTATKSIEVSSCLDIDTELSNQAILVYPNPFNERLVIENRSSSPKELELVNSLGQPVGLVWSISENKTIHTRKLSSGVYYLIENVPSGEKKILTKVQKL